MSPEYSSFLQKLLVNRSFSVWTDKAPCPMCERKGTPSPRLMGTSGPRAAGEGWPQVSRRWTTAMHFLR